MVRTEGYIHHHTEMDKDHSFCFTTNIRNDKIPSKAFPPLFQ